VSQQRLLGRNRTAAPRPAPLWVGVLAAVLSGILVAVQARMTSGLSEQATGGEYTAGLITVSTGALVLLLALTLSRDARRGFATVAIEVRSRALPWWALLGGVGGSFFLIVQGAAAGPLGLAMYTMAVVAGQVLGGLLFDSFGLAGGSPTKPSILRAVGSLATIAAVAWSVLPRGELRIDVWLTLLAVGAGVVLAFVNGVNGRVQRSAGHALVPALTSHALGLVLILALWLILIPGAGEAITLPQEPWLYAGGLIGAITMAVATAFVGVLGVLLLGLGMVSGQLVGALTIDLAISPPGGVQPSTVIGVLLTLGAVAITYVDSSRRERFAPQETSPTHSP
jgi:transporter family-2 protein